MQAQEYIVSTPQVRDRVSVMVGSLDLTQRFCVKISKAKSRRSLSQNALYHKWVGILGQHLGYHHDEMATELKELFLPAAGRHHFIGLDNVEKVRLTTTGLSKSDMSQYMSAIDQFAAENGVLLPHPEDAHARL